MTEVRHASFTIAASHPAFPGHFPGRPIVPGVVLLDQAIGQIEQATALRIAGIANAKFLSPVLPDEIIEMEYTCSAQSVQVKLVVAQRAVASAKLLLAAGAS